MEVLKFEHWLARSKIAVSVKESNYLKEALIDWHSHK